MKNLLTTINEIEKIDDDFINKFKQLFLDYTNWHPFLQMIDRTRNHEVCLLICDNFEKILLSHKEKFTLKEFDSIDQKIILLRLNCLDKTDRWNKYIEYFDDIFKMKKYYSTYSIECDIERFERFYLETKNGYHHVHFLYSGYRYEVIQRKIAKSLKSNKLGNLRHHLQSELTDVEIEHRYNEVLKLADDLKRMNEKFW